MRSKLEPGDRVAWETSQGKTRGKIVRKLESTTRIKGYAAKASKADPMVLVESEKTGAKAAHKPTSLSKA